MTPQEANDTIIEVIGSIIDNLEENGIDLTFNELSEIRRVFNVIFEGRGVSIE